MSRNLTWAAVIAVSLAGMKAMAANPAPAHAAPATFILAAVKPAAVNPADRLSRVLGGISKVDTQAKTITLSGYGGGDETLAYNDNTKFMLDIRAAVSDIEVGDTLRAITLGGGDAPGAKSITPNFLNIVPPVDVNGPPFTGPFTPKEGIVASLKPLTIKAGKQKITIKIAPSTLLSKSKDATIADVEMGKFGSAIVKGEGAGRVLTELHIIQPPDNK